MEIREIEGKKFIEFDEDKQRKKRLIISVVFLILLTIAIIALITTTVTLVKNKDIIKQDPLRYGMDLHGFNSCECTDDKGQLWTSKDSGFVNQFVGDGWINYSQPEYSTPNFSGIFNTTHDGTN